MTDPTDRPLAPLLIIEDGELRCAALDRHACVKALVKELDAQRAALAELRAKVGRLRSPLVFDMRRLPWQFRCSWCEANWSLTDDRGFVSDACGHPQSDCGFHDWLTAQSRPSPGAGEE